MYNYNKLYYIACIEYVDAMEISLPWKLLKMITSKPINGIAS